MDGLGVAANVIAVIELSAKIASVCIQYSLAVKHSKAEIERLRGEVDSLTGLLQGVEELLKRPEKTQLAASQGLRDAIRGCFSPLTQLSMTLDPGKTRKTMSRIGIRALKWPFESKGVEKIINDLERCKQTITLALQLDQTALTLGVHHKIDLAKLLSAKGAEFNSHLDEHDARCLPNTRVDLLRKITEWAEDAQSTCIFWLNGMAGTGKSTISRTVAQSFADKGQLGASFFFKRGEGDRGNATRFFTTIAVQLAAKVPSLGQFVGLAINADTTIFEKALEEQFEKLILQPLSSMQEVSLPVSRLVIVVDALDECEREGDIRTILRLLSRLRDVTSMYLRIFVTSRPELPIRLGFKNMEGSMYQDLVLHEISQATIKHDIFVFLQDEFAKLRVERSLSMDWPGQENIEALVEMSVPLFIFAATVCRFVRDPRWDPKKRLATILKYQTVSQASKLDRTYLPVLDQLLVGQDEVEKEQLAKEFQDVVGTIVVLADPLSITSLASLLCITEGDITCRLDLLHAVFSLPTNPARPVRLLHLSFRDFLLDPLKRGKSPFWVDEKKTHEKIASKCLHLLSSRLKKDICNMQRPGTLRSEIDSQDIDNHLPAEVQYACRYWVYHLMQIKSSLYDEGQVHVFFREHLLHWLEAMSLLEYTSESITMITTLHSILEAKKSPNLQALVHDAKRFVLYNRLVIEQAPLQLYCSALVFSPEQSIIRRQFEDHIPTWIQTKPRVQEDWSSALQVFEGHSESVLSVAFSPNCKQVVSGSHDWTVRLWDAETGAARLTLKGHSSTVTSVAFSPDGRQVISGSNDRTVRLWDAETGAVRLTLNGHSDSVMTVAFSLDGKLVVSGSWDETVRLWDAGTGAARQTLEGHSSTVTSVAFSPDSKQVVSGSYDNTVRLWDVETGVARLTLEGHSSWVLSVAFSLDSTRVVSGSDDNTVQLWDAKTGAARQTLKGHLQSVTSVAFSPDGKLVASSSHDKTVRLWDVEMGVTYQALEGHSDSVYSVSFSIDGKMVVSGSYDMTVRLWDAETRAARLTLECHSNTVTSVVVSLDGRQVVSGSYDRTVRLWDAETGAARLTLEGHLHSVASVAFSPDGKQVVSGSYDNTVQLWDTETGTARQTLKGHSAWVLSVAFSPDGNQVVSGSHDNTVRLWDAKTGAIQQTLKGHSAWVLSVAFSPDGNQVVSGSHDQTVRLWDAKTGAARLTLKGHSSTVMSVAFSPDGKQIVSGSDDNTVRLWDASMGAAQQTLEGHLNLAKSVAFSPNGDMTMGLFVSNDWVMEGKIKLLWLHPDYRATCTAVWNRIVVLGHSSGRVSILAFEKC